LRLFKTIRYIHFSIIDFLETEVVMQKKIKFSFGIFSLALILLMIIPQWKENQKGPVTEEPGILWLLKNKDLQLLGEKLFFDERLSDPEGQSCASCHGPDVGWTGPDEEVNKTGGVYPGALHSRFGNRKPNSSAYATLSPLFHTILENGKIIFVGGNFWDGRATGAVLGNPAADQAQGPFLNPVEQNIARADIIIEKVRASEYSSLFEKAGREIWGINDVNKCKDINLLYGIVGIAIAAYENSDKVNQFSSKYDYYLMGRVKLTEKELKGLELFNGKGKCALCHTNDYSQGGSLPLFTDFTFENLGVPKNPLNPWYKMDSNFNKEGADWIDTGLADYLKGVPQYAMLASENIGKHQVPTLRNVDKRPSKNYVKAFCHNGYFKSLQDIVHFYNTRDLLPSPGTLPDPKPGINCWPEPEVSANINKTETGNLGLTYEEETLIVEFLKTLSDGFPLPNR
jgi:cytochrome c peroxidase